MQADLVIFPFVDRFALCTPKHAGYDVHGALDGAIGAWLAAMSARPSCKNSRANSEALLQAYRCVSRILRLHAIHHITTCLDKEL